MIKLFQKTIPENGETLNSVPDCNKNQEMCNKTVDNSPHALEFFPECYKTQEMCDKVLNRCFLYLILLLINIKLNKCVTVLFLRMFFQ